MPEIDEKISAESFAELFESSASGTAFHIMGGAVPGPDEQAGITVSTYNYAQGADFLEVFSERHFMHGDYSFNFPYADVTIQADKKPGFSFDVAKPEYRVLRVSLEAGRSITASLVALGHPWDENDYWLVREQRAQNVEPVLLQKPASFVRRLLGRQ